MHPTSYRAPQDQAEEEEEEAVPVFLSRTVCYVLRGNGQRKAREFFVWAFNYRHPPFRPASPKWMLRTRCWIRFEDYLVHPTLPHEYTESVVLLLLLLLGFLVRLQALLQCSPCSGRVSFGGRRTPHNHRHHHHRNGSSCSYTLPRNILL